MQTTNPLAIKTTSADAHTLRAYWVIVGLDLLLIAASAAMSYSYFAMLFEHTRLPEGAVITLSVLITTLLSVAIGYLMNMTVASYLRRIWQPQNNNIMVLLIVLVAWDAYGNIVGTPSLLEAATKEAAFVAPTYPAQAELDRLKAEAADIQEKNTDKRQNRTFIQKGYRKQFTVLQDAVSEHEKKKAELFAAANADFETAREQRKQHLAAANVGLRYFNIAAYFVMLILTFAKNRIEISVDERESRNISSRPREISSRRSEISAKRPISRAISRPEISGVAAKIGYDSPRVVELSPEISEDELSHMSADALRMMRKAASQKLSLAQTRLRNGGGNRETSELNAAAAVATIRKIDKILNA